MGEPPKRVPSIFISEHVQLPRFEKQSSVPAICISAVEVAVPILNDSETRSSANPIESTPLGLVVPPKDTTETSPWKRLSGRRRVSQQHIMGLSESDRLTKKLVRQDSIRRLSMSDDTALLHISLDVTPFVSSRLTASQKPRLNTATGIKDSGSHKKSSSNSSHSKKPWKRYTLSKTEKSDNGLLDEEDSEDDDSDIELDGYIDMIDDIHEELEEDDEDDDEYGDEDEDEFGFGSRKLNLNIPRDGIKKSRSMEDIGRTKQANSSKCISMEHALGAHGSAMEIMEELSFSSSGGQSSFFLDLPKNLSIPKLSRKMRNKKYGVKLIDHQQSNKVYEKSFTGEALVDWLMRQCKIDEREIAVSLGQFILDQKVIFLSHQGAVFKDSPRFFYHFKDNDKMIEEKKVKFDITLLRRETGITGLREELNLCREMLDAQTGVQTITKKTLFGEKKVHFSGNAITDWMKDRKQISDQKALELAQFLINNGHIRSFDGDTAFDKSKIYKFSNRIGRATERKTLRGLPTTGADTVVLNQFEVEGGNSKIKSFRLLDDGYVVAIVRMKSLPDIILVGHIWDDELTTYQCSSNIICWSVSFPWIISYHENCSIEMFNILTQEGKRLQLTLPKELKQPDIRKPQVIVIDKISESYAVCSPDYILLPSLDGSSDADLIITSCCNQVSISSLREKDLVFSNGILLLPSGQYFCVWDVENGEILLEGTPKNDFQSYLKIVMHKNIVAAADPLWLRIYSLDDGEEKHAIRQHAPISSMVLDDIFLITGSTNGVIELWWREDFTLIYRIDPCEAGLAAESDPMFLLNVEVSRRLSCAAPVDRDILSMAMEREKKEDQNQSLKQHQIPAKGKKQNKQITTVMRKLHEKLLFKDGSIDVISESEKLQHSNSGDGQKDRKDLSLAKLTEKFKSMLLDSKKDWKEDQTVNSIGQFAIWQLARAGSWVLFGFRNMVCMWEISSVLGYTTVRGYLASGPICNIFVEHNHVLIELKTKVPEVMVLTRSDFELVNQTNPADIVYKGDCVTELLKPLPQSLPNIQEFVNSHCWWESEIKKHRLTYIIFHDLLNDKNDLDWVKSWSEVAGLLRRHNSVLYGISSNPPDVVRQIQNSMALSFHLLGDPSMILAQFLKVPLINLPRQKFRNKKVPGSAVIVVDNNRRCYYYYACNAPTIRKMAKSGRFWGRPVPYKVILYCEKAYQKGSHLDIRVNPFPKGYSQIMSFGMNTSLFRVKSRKTDIAYDQFVKEYEKIMREGK